jgi:hypothetical protein
VTAQGEDLLAWLDGAITLREQVARLAQKGAEGRWHSGGDPDDRNADEFEFKATHVADDQGRLVVYNEVHPSKAQSVHIALNDPASVLRRCAADRKALALYGETVAIREKSASALQAAQEHGYQPDRRVLDDWSRANREAAVMLPLIQLLAEGYGWTGGER